MTVPTVERGLEPVVRCFMWCYRKFVNETETDFGSEQRERTCGIVYDAIYSLPTYKMTYTKIEPVLWPEADVNVRGWEEVAVGIYDCVKALECGFPGDEERPRFGRSKGSLDARKLYCRDARRYCASYVQSLPSVYDFFGADDADDW